MLNKAIEIATIAHAGQVDKGGAPYILHSLRVMLSREDELERICAVLHDVIEDTDITFDDLRKAGFSEEVMSVLDYLTKRKGESYDDFINRMLTNETACHVKLADISDNMNLTRIANLTDEDLARMEKYRRASDQILDALPWAEVEGNEREIKISGHVTIQSFMSEDDFMERFISFIESHGWFFGGGAEDVTDKD